MFATLSPSDTYLTKHVLLDKDRADLCVNSLDISATLPGNQLVNSSTKVYVIH